MDLVEGVEKYFMSSYHPTIESMRKRRRKTNDFLEAIKKNRTGIVDAITGYRLDTETKDFETLKDLKDYYEGK
jgi:hypothetical protein